VVVPPFGEIPEPSPKRGLLSRVLRRRQSTLPAYDFQSVVVRIEEALEQSKRDAAASEGVEPAFEIIDAPPSPVSVDEEPVHESPIQRQRAQRWTSTQLPWLSSIKLPWGLELNLLNISSSGVLLESGMRLEPGSMTTLQLSGTQHDITVPARVIRSRVATVDSLGVKYHTAAVFERAFDMLKASDDGPIDYPAHLRDLIATIRERAASGAHPAELRSEFEAGILEIVSAREIRLRDVPLVEDNGCDSVYFTVPTADHSPAVLQVTFEPGCVPSEDEFAALRAAAAAVAKVLPLTGTARHFSVSTRTASSRTASPLRLVSPPASRDELSATA
jgi:hypothetical protein